MAVVKTPPDVGQPNKGTDPWLVATLTRIDERSKRTREDIKAIKQWITDHDVRHRKIDGKMAIIGIGVPIATAVVVALVMIALTGGL